MKLHLGCGERYLNGYVHVDIAEFDHIDFIRPVDDLSCFKKNTVSEIYASHVLEYFDKEYAPEVLNEWKRVLKPNGILHGELAKNWEVVSDAKEWIFNLRKNVKFHNNKTFNADDVIDTFEFHNHENSSTKVIL